MFRRHRFASRRRLAVVGLIGIVVLVVMSMSAAAQSRPEAFGKRGMVVAATPVAAQIGQQILAKGGNAVDAAVATAAAVGLLEPNLSSPFGVGYLLFYSPELGEVKGLEFGGRGPNNLSLDAYASDSERAQGAKSIAVPGNIAGWITLLEAYGTMSAAEVFAPVIELASEGFPLTETLAQSINTLVSRFPYEETHRTFAKPDGTPWEAGDLFKNPGYAETLHAVATEGLGVVYGGRIGEQIAATVQKYGGFMTIEDLEAFEPEWMTPIQTTYRGYTIYTTAPPSTGIQVLQTLNILEGFDLAAMGHGTPEYYHIFMEAVNLAATDRDAYVGDPDFVDVPVGLLLSKELAAERRALIDPTKATTSYPPSFQEGTTHLAAADQWGNVVAITQTIAGGWGSGLVAGDTGIILNNAYAYANLKPDHPGVIGPNRRQAWCLSPVMIFDAEGRFWASVGTPGGETIQQTEAQVISNLIDFGMGPQAAVEAPRFAHTWMGQPTFTYPDFGVLNTAIDAGLDPEVYEALTAMGHELQIGTPWGYTGSNAVIRYDAETGWYRGGADPRRQLYAVGL